MTNDYVNSNPIPQSSVTGLVAALGAKADAVSVARLRSTVTLLTWGLIAVSLGVILLVLLLLSWPTQ